MSSIVMLARASTWRQASTGPRPMISGLSPVTPLATMRASGVMPSALAFVSLITMTAAAPSLSGQALPAVTVPPSRKTGLRLASPSSVVLGRGPSSLVTTRAVGQRDRDDLALEEAVLLRLRRPGSARAARTRPSPARPTFSYSATFSAVWPMAM